MILLLAPLVAAAPAVTDLGFVLSAPSEGIFAGGVNAPTVAWDGSQYVMYFESSARTADIPSDCATFYWIGRATSPDGVTWTMDAEPVLTPDRGDPTSIYSCVVSQPAVVFDGTTWHLFFSMADEKQDSSSSNNLAAGIGYATSTDGVRFTPQQLPTALGDFGDGDAEWHEPDGGAQTLSLGMPSVALVNRTLRLVYQVSTRLYAAKLDLDTGFWSLWDPEVTTGFTGQSWATYGVFSPALLCDGATESYELSVGGYTDSTYTVRALGNGSSEDLVSWTTPAEALMDGVFADMNHLEVFPDGDDRMVFYSKTDPSTGVKGVGLALVTDAGSATASRMCAWDESPPDTGDTGDTADTGDTDTDVPDTDTDTGGDTDSGEDTDTDTGGTYTDDGCGCTSTGTGALPVLAALGALAAVRRRRR